MYNNVMVDLFFHKVDSHGVGDAVGGVDIGIYEVVKLNVEHPKPLRDPPGTIMGRENVVPPQATEKSFLHNDGTGSGDDRGQKCMTRDDFGRYCVNSLTSNATLEDGVATQEEYAVFINGLRCLFLHGEEAHTLSIQSAAVDKQELPPNVDAADDLCPDPETAWDFYRLPLFFQRNFLSKVCHHVRDDGENGNGEECLEKLRGRHGPKVGDFFGFLFKEPEENGATKAQAHIDSLCGDPRFFDSVVSEKYVVECDDVREEHYVDVRPVRKAVHGNSNGNHRGGESAILAMSSFLLFIALLSAFPPFRRSLKRRFSCSDVSKGDEYESGISSNKDIAEHGDECDADQTTSPVVAITFSTPPAQSMHVAVDGASSTVSPILSSLSSDSDCQMSVAVTYTPTSNSTFTTSIASPAVAAMTFFLNVFSTSGLRKSSSPLSSFSNLNLDDAAKRDELEKGNENAERDDTAIPFGNNSVVCGKKRRNFFLPNIPRPTEAQLRWAQFGARERAVRTRQMVDRLYCKPDKKNGATATERTPAAQRASSSSSLSSLSTPCPSTTPMRTLTPAASTISNRNGDQKSGITLIPEEQGGGEFVDDEGEEEYREPVDVWKGLNTTDEQVDKGKRHGCATKTMGTSGNTDVHEEPATPTKREALGDYAVKLARVLFPSVQEVPEGESETNDEDEIVCEGRGATKGTHLYSTSFVSSGLTSSHFEDDCASDESTEDDSLVIFFDVDGTSAKSRSVNRVEGKEDRAFGADAVAGHCIPLIAGDFHIPGTVTSSPSRGLPNTVIVNIAPIPNKLKNVNNGNAEHATIVEKINSPVTQGTSEVPPQLFDVALEGFSYRHGESPDAHEVGMFMPGDDDCYPWEMLMDEDGRYDDETTKYSFIQSVAVNEKVKGSFITGEVKGDTFRFSAVKGTGIDSDTPEAPNRLGMDRYSYHERGQQLKSSAATQGRSTSMSCLKRNDEVDGKVGEGLMPIPEKQTVVIKRKRGRSISLMTGKMDTEADLLVDAL